jgi:hypothetical protein
VSPGAIGSEFIVLIEVPIVLLSLGLWNLEAVLLPIYLGYFTSVSLALCQKCVTGIFSSSLHHFPKRKPQFATPSDNFRHVPLIRHKFYMKLAKLWLRSRAYVMKKVKL